MLAAPAAAGWSPADLNQLVRDWLGVGKRIPDQPSRPIGLLGALLAWHGRDNLAERPAALEEARIAAEDAQRRERIAAAAAEHEEFQAARARAVAARGGPGHTALRRELKQIEQRRLARRTGEAAREAARVQDAVRRARGRS